MVYYVTYELSKLDKVILLTLQHNGKLYENQLARILGFNVENDFDSTPKRYADQGEKDIFNGILSQLTTFGLININEKEVLVDQNVKSCIVNIKERYGKKTGGWINEFINYYFSRYIDGLDNTELKVEKFANDFKELNFILRKSLNMLK